MKEAVQVGVKHLRRSPGRVLRWLGRSRLVRWITWRRAVVASAVGVLGLILLSWLAMVFASKGRIAAVEESPSAEVVIVPGARVWEDGTPSGVLKKRLEAAATLYEEEKVKHILVSGDNRQSHYNEPEAMQRYLRTLDIPAEHITLDYAGFDTWDTCLRAKEQFGVSEALVVTQHRYAQRTAALCNAAGIKATVAAVPNFFSDWLPSIRERLASVKAMGDMVRKPDAHHGGPYVGLVGSIDGQL